MPEITLKGLAIVEGLCEGEALVSKKPLSFLGGVDPTNGNIIEKHHDLRGKCLKDKALCFLASAIIGKTPDYGMHQAENRRPNVIVNVEAPPAKRSRTWRLRNSPRPNSKR